jgi:hypothetical protein
MNKRKDQTWLSKCFFKPPSGKRAYPNARGSVELLLFPIPQTLDSNHILETPGVLYKSTGHPERQPVLKRKVYQ